MCQIAWSIESATMIQTFLNQRQVLTPIYIKRWYGQLGNRVLRLFLHLQHTHVIIYSYDTSTLQTLEFRLMITHDYRRVLLLEIINEALKREIKNIVGGKYDDVIIDMFHVDGQ